jgi:hypothetical protein
MEVENRITEIVSAGARRRLTERALLSVQDGMLTVDPIIR